MSGASGGGKLATVDLVTSVSTVGTITNPVDADIVQGTTIVNASVALTTASATQMLGISSTRKSIMIRNDTVGVDMYVGSSSAVNAANGMPLKYGETMIIDRAASAAVWMYQASGATVYPRFLTEFA